MVNLVWMLLLIGGIVVSGVKGQITVVTTTAFSAAQAAVKLALELAGIMALWLGLLKIAEEAGLVVMLAKLFRPLTRLLFPGIPKDHPALGAIMLNLSANLLGLGNAATPFGLKAMQELQTLNNRPAEATEAMCTFLALNTACITLVPATVIALRAGAGSANPAEIIGPTIFATATSMVVAITVDRFFRKIYGQRRRG
jgi:spore maturation protein A